MQADERVLRTCIDEFDKMLYVYTSKCRLLGFKIGSTQEGNSTDNLAEARNCFIASSQDSLEGVKVVQMDYIQECQGVVMCFENGAMYLYKDPEWTEAGEIGDGILTGSWAPNQEYLAVATKAGKLIIFTPEFDVLYEADIDDDDLTFGADEEMDPTVRDA